MKIARPGATALSGALLWALGMLAGGALLALFLSRMAFGLRPPGDVVGSMLVGAAVAFPACFFYLWVPVVFDRYAPEPWWCLAMVFLWGAVPACGFSGWINTIAAASLAASAGSPSSALLGATVVAPLVEEGFKAAAVLGMFAFLHHEFDGVVDGVVYATFVALGFAATENVVYYAQAFQKDGWEGMSTLFLVRGVLAPWGHPLYTSMTGLGVGIARETTRPWLKLAAPLGGYAAAVALHALWNRMAEFLDSDQVSTATFSVAFPALLSLWLLFVAAFGVLVVALVRRERNNIRQHLLPEVQRGTLSAEELEQVCSLRGRLRALLRRGSQQQRALVDAASRLGLSGWHAARERKQDDPAHGEELAALRGELARARAAG